jgi:hypothetical protein
MKMVRKKPITVPASYRRGFMADLDNRFRLPRVLIARRDAYVEDHGGTESLSRAQGCLIDRAVYLEALINEMESVHASGGGIEHAVYGQTVNTLLGVLKALGLKRAAKAVPSLREYIAHGNGRHP